MTSEQSSKLQSLLKKYNIVPKNDPDMVNYILILFGIGYGMSEEEIEGYVFSDRGKVIDKDLCRIALLLDLPKPGKDTAPEEFIREVVKERKEQEELCRRFESLLEKSGMTLEQAEQQGGLFPDPAGSIKHTYQEIKEKILTESGFSAAQLDQVQRAVALNMPEEVILHFATPDKTPLQMERYIDFYQMGEGNRQIQQKEKKIIRLFSLLRRYVKRKGEQK